ncbi:MAG: ATP-binding protein [Acidobacteriota bacterium]
MNIPSPFRLVERLRIHDATIAGMELAARCRGVEELLDFWAREIADEVRPDGAALFLLEGHRWIRTLPEDPASDPPALNDASLVRAAASAEPVRMRALTASEPEVVLARYSARDGWRGVLAIWGSRRRGSRARIRRAAWFASAVGRTASVLRKAETGREQAIAGERTRWAAELHDGHLQSLSSVKLLAEVCSSIEEQHQEVCLALGPADAPSRLRTELARLIDLANETVREARHYLLELRSPPSDAEHFVPWLRAYTDDFERESSIPVELRIEGEGELPRIQVQDTTRLIREALTNVRKHAKAGSVRIALVFSESGTTISISDDGVGFDLRSTLEALLDSSHNGLTGSRYRVESIGGEMRLRSAPGRGTTVSFRLPPESRRPTADQRREDREQAERRQPAHAEPAGIPGRTHEGIRDTLANTISALLESSPADSEPDRAYPRVGGEEDDGA